MKLLAERLAFVYSEKPTLEGVRGQTGLVKASGASKSVVNQWLDGSIKSLRLDYALNMERNLGFNHVWLILGVGDIYASPTTAGLQLSPQAIEVARAFDQISDVEKAMVLKSLGISQQAFDNETLRKHGFG